MIRLALVLCAALTAAIPVAAQETHIVMIAGLGGDPEYTNTFHGWLSRFADAASERYGIERSRIHYFGEDPELDPTAIVARSTADNIRDGLVALAESLAPEDQVVLVMAGHGTFRDGVARFNIPGPDLTPPDLATLVDGLGNRPVTVVNMATASGPFIEALSGPGRIVITATRTGREQNSTRFGLHFVDAFASEGADQDKDNRVSMLEAFNYAVQEVAREYEGEGQLLTEHALLDDNGDGEGSEDLDGTEDGALARRAFLASAVTGPDTRAMTPALRALHAEKTAIESKIDDLKGVKGQLPQDRYENELEALLIELALKNREIRAAGGGT